MGPEQWLFLQWHEHKGSLVSTFEKLFERNIFVDCTLAAEGQYLNVHKMILSACSPYFEILLNENRDKHPIIILKDVKFRSLKSIIEYMYRGEANVLSTEIKDFLAAAETLQIKGLGKQGGGDTRGQPTKDLRDIVEESLPSCPPEMPIGVGEKENWRGTDHLSSVLSEAAHENAAPKNILFSQGDIVRSIGPQKVPVPILCSQEVETEKPWLKTESTIETSQCLKSVLPTLNLGTHTIEPVHPGSVDQVSDKNACSTSTQNVPKMSDVQMDMEMTPKHEPEPVAQSTPIPPDIEEAETASIVSSVIELSDTTEEWAEEDMEEGPTGSQATANSFAGGTDESRAHFDGASDATRDSVSRDLGSDQQGFAKGTFYKQMKMVVRGVTVAGSGKRKANVVPKQSFQRENKSASQPRPTNKDRKKLAVVSKPRNVPRQHVPYNSPYGRPSPALLSSKVHTCPICKKRFSWLCFLKKHMRLHKNERFYKCEECGFVTKSFKQFREHQRRHSITVPAEPPSRFYSCPICHEIFPWLCHLKRHMKVHTAEIQNFALSQNDPKHFIHLPVSGGATHECMQSFKNGPFRCLQCQANYKTRNDLIRHINKIHGYPQKKKIKDTESDKSVRSKPSSASPRNTKAFSNATRCLACQDQSCTLCRRSPKCKQCTGKSYNLH